MRRPLLAGIGFAAVLIVAACSTDEPSQVPLAPTKPSLALSDICSGNLASQIAKEQKALPISAIALSDLQDKFKVIKNSCPNVTQTMALNYIDAVIGWATLPTSFTNATKFLTHWKSVTNYTTGTGLVLPEAVLQAQGGAAVLNPGETMTTFDNRARLQVPLGSTPGGPHLYTFEKQSSTNVCAAATSQNVTSVCYNLQDYPHETSYTPKSILTICLRTGGLQGNRGIGHVKAGFGTEVLPFTPAGFFDCSTIPHDEVASWLRLEGGPLGRVVASAYDYLRPKPLFADDAGESGSIGSFSLVGGVIEEIFFDDISEYDGIPDIGDSWADTATSPGYIRFEPSLGNLTGGVVVLSQGQGACPNCPVFSLLGTRVNSAEADSSGTYEITWTSVQDQPSVKEGPFVVLNNDSLEIARVSYVSRGNNDVIMFKVGNDSTDVTTWNNGFSQNFKLTVSLKKAQAPHTPFTVSLSVDGGTAVTKTSANAFTLKQIGYILTGIDAGIIGAKNFKIVRVADGTP